jgi:hypothetical protein
MRSTWGKVSPVSAYRREVLTTRNVLDAALKLAERETSRGQGCQLVTRDRGEGG